MNRMPHHECGEHGRLADSEVVRNYKATRVGAEQSSTHYLNPLARKTDYTAEMKTVTPGWPERNRSFRQLKRFRHAINSDRIFGTHSRRQIPARQIPGRQRRASGAQRLSILNQNVGKA